MKGTAKREMLRVEKERRMGRGRKKRQEIGIEKKKYGKLRDEYGDVEGEREEIAEGMG